MIFKITPASVSVGLSSAVMFPLEPALDRQEIEKLLLDLNKFCELYGLSFLAPSRFFVGANLVFARVPNLKIKLFKFKKSCGKPMADYLPTGPEGIKINAWMTEIQMFLHQHPVNISRRNKNQGTVDILWFEPAFSLLPFWGGGLGWRVR